MVLGPDVFRGRNLDPFRLDPRTTQHRFDPLAALVRNHKHSRALLTRPASTA